MFLQGITMMQIPALQKEQKITPLLRLGFRPFFLSGAVCGDLALMLMSARKDGRPG